MLTISVTENKEVIVGNNYRKEEQEIDYNEIRLGQEKFT